MKIKHYLKVIMALVLILTLQISSFNILFASSQGISTAGTFVNTGLPEDQKANNMLKALGFDVKQLQRKNLDNSVVV